MKTQTTKATITVAARDLRQILTGLGKVLGKHPPDSAPGCVRIIADGSGAADIAATGGETWASVRLPEAAPGGQAEFLVPVVRLKELIRPARPGEPVTLPVPPRVENVSVRRPDGTDDRIEISRQQTLHYARTRQVGVYQLETGTVGRDRFAVNLFNPTESQIQPATILTLGDAAVQAKAGAIDVNKPAWPYFLLAMLVLLLLEWVVYNKRVFV